MGKTVYKSCTCVQVDGLPIPYGAETEPVMLSITHGNPLQFSRGFPRSMTLSEVRSVIEDMTGIAATDMLLSRVLTKGASLLLFKSLIYNIQRIWLL